MMDDDIQVTDSDNDIRERLYELVDDVAYERLHSDRIVLPRYVPTRSNGRNMSLDDATESDIDAAIHALMPNTIEVAAGQLDRVVKLILAKTFKREP